MDDSGACGFWQGRKWCSLEESYWWTVYVCWSEETQFLEDIFQFETIIWFPVHSRSRRRDILSRLIQHLRHCFRADRPCLHQKLTARWYWWVMKLWNCYDSLLVWSSEFFKMIYWLKQYHKFTLKAITSSGLIMLVNIILESSKFWIVFIDEIKLFVG